MMAAAVALALGLGRAGASTYTVLHGFDSPPEWLQALAFDTEGNIYGTSLLGGVYGSGSIYRISKDGSNFTILHSFSYRNFAEGMEPGESLVVIGTDIFGTTSSGGTAGGLGTVFKMKTDGTNFVVLYSFSGALNGSVLSTSLISDGATNLYGTTAAGGLNGLGLIFTIKTDGTGFSILHSFAGGNDGTTPQAPLALDSVGNLYGTTSAGGQAGWGTIFVMKTDGTGFYVLHSFSSGDPSPSPVTLDGVGNLYGVTLGTVFMMRNDGTGFLTLHSFTASSTSDGWGPQTPLILSGRTLYGTTNSGGANNHGTVFRLSVNGTSFTILHSFSGGLSDGSFPGGALILDGSGKLFGTSQFGVEGGSGALFSIKTDGTGFLLLRAFNALEGTHLYGSLIRDGAGFLYGTCERGGSYGYGTIFKVKTDGTGLVVLHSFSGLAWDGVSPMGTLVLDGFENLYGISAGDFTSGTVFKIKTDGTGFSVLHSFGAQDEPNPWLLLDDAGFLYGTTYLGGVSGLGSIFKLRTDGSGFATIHSFGGGPSDGDYPRSPLVLLGSDNLYGTTASGGGTGAGTVYTLKADGSGFSLLHSLGTGANPDGSSPAKSLIADQGVLYGAAVSGGMYGGGAIFRINPDGGNYALVYSLGPGGSASFVPDGLGNLLVSREAAFGTGGNDGSLSAFTTSGAGYASLHQFSGSPSDGSEPYAPVLRDSYENGTLFGTTVSGGALGGGTIFRISSDATGSSLSAPVIASPTEAQVINASRVNFSWGAVGGAAGYQFLATDTSNGIAIYSGSTNGLSSTSTAADLPQGGMTFGVRACSGGFADANCGPFATVDFTISILPPTTSSTKFYTLTPCRIVDTRNAPGLYGGPALQAGVSRVFTLAGKCGIPTGTKSVSVNITVVLPTSDGTLKLNPTGADPTVATAVSFAAGCVRANNAMAFLGSDGAVSVFDDQETGTTHFIIDTNGYFK